MARTASAATSLPPGPAPLYSRLRKALRERVASGECPPGARIPTIQQLGELYGVSRITVTQALDSLARDGLLLRWQGKGVFVSQPSEPEQPRLCLLSFTEETARRGHAPSSRTLRLLHQAAPPGVSAKLGIGPDEPVVLLERLRLVDGSPMALQHVYLPEHLVPGLVERTSPIESLYQLLADTYGVVPTNASESYEPIQLGPDEARLLETQPGAPAFHVDRTTSDQHGRTIEFASSVLRGDKYEVRLLLSRSLPQR